ARIDDALAVAKLAKPRERRLEPPLGAVHFLLRIRQSVVPRPRRQIIDQALGRGEDRLSQLQRIVWREGSGPDHYRPVSDVVERVHLTFPVPDQLFDRYRELQP